MPKKNLEREARRQRRKELTGFLDSVGVTDAAGVQDLFKELVGAVLENGLEGELEEELGYSKYDYRNTRRQTTAATATAGKRCVAAMETSSCRCHDRKGEYEPQIVKRHQTSLSQDIEEKIISMYAKGMSTSDIEAHIRDIYGLSVSDSTVSRVTDKILPVMREWQQRPLESVYAVVFMDAIHFHVRSEGQIVKKAVYIAIGVQMDGIRNVLGMWVGENKSAKFWLSILNSLRNRGVHDILIACVDGLTGFPNAIETV